MRFEIVAGMMLPKIGFGTWTIGGGMRADQRRDVQWLAVLQNALELGYTHFDTAEIYGGGHCEELLGTAIRDTGVDRSNLFVTTKVSPEHLTYQRVLRSCEDSLRRLRMEYVDLYLIHWSNPLLPLTGTFRALNKLVRDGKARSIGVSNFSLKLLEQSVRLSETLLLTNQIPYSLMHRSYVRNGVFAYCRNNSILVTAYSPFEVGKLRENAVLQSIAKDHAVSPYQIALAWLCNQAGVITIPMSSDPQHQKANLEAADISLSLNEMEQLS